VIIHELAHLVYFNHSEKFWSLVAKYEPEYKSLRKRLKSFDFLTRLY
ncbi:MAG: M48 family metallopeptidase, partial [Clostridia bacterium]|nr:M48 family metallopeptidase [Clostridia bacterium]